MNQFVWYLIVGGIAAEVLAGISSYYFPTLLAGTFDGYSYLYWLEAVGAILILAGVLWYVVTSYHPTSSSRRRR